MCQVEREFVSVNIKLRKIQILAEKATHYDLSWRKLPVIDTVLNSVSTDDIVDLITRKDQTERIAHLLSKDINENSRLVVVEELYQKSLENKENSDF